eukprot:3085060-Pleurochrysis_carterae.AAC.1
MTRRPQKAQERAFALKAVCRACIMSASVWFVRPASRGVECCVKSESSRLEIAATYTARATSCRGRHKNMALTRIRLAGILDSTDQLTPVKPSMPPRLTALLGGSSH